MSKVKFTPQAQTLLKNAYMIKQIHKLLSHGLEGLCNVSVGNTKKYTGKRKRTAQDGSVAHKHQSAKDFRRICDNIKLAVDTLEVIAKNTEKMAANIGGYEQASAFARRNPYTRYPWSERNATFGLKQFLNAPDNESSSTGPRHQHPRKQTLGTLLGPGASNHGGKEASVHTELKRNHKKTKKEKNCTNTTKKNAVERKATKASSTLAAAVKKLQKRHPSETRTFRRLKKEVAQQSMAMNREDRWLTPFETVSFLAKVHQQAPHALQCARRYLLEESLVPVKERRLYGITRKFVKATNPPPLHNSWGHANNHVVEDAATFDTFADDATKTGEFIDPIAVGAHLQAKKRPDGSFQCDH